MSVKEPLKGGTAYVPPPDDNLLWYKADNERLRAVALQAQNAAIDLAKQRRTTADDARELLIITGAIRETPPAMPCAYPHCCDKAGNRCPRMFAGQCSGPRAADPQQVGR